MFGAINLRHYLDDLRQTSRRLDACEVLEAPRTRREVRRRKRLHMAMPYPPNIPNLPGSPSSQNHARLIRRTFRVFLRDGLHAGAEGIDLLRRISGVVFAGGDEALHVRIGEREA